jgi:diaminopimelate epimerase
MLPFTKMQAVGNDFVVVEARDWPADTDWNNVAIRLCDRHFGIGSDGLLLVSPSPVADFQMRMFNPDGTEDMCGNGLRCVFRFAAKQGYFTGLHATGETLNGVHTATSPDGILWSVGMGSPQFDPEAIPVLVEADAVLNYPLEVEEEEILVSAVSTGSTHTVLFVPELPNDERFFHISPLIEHHPLYPERTSVMWATPDDGESGSAWRIRIWERGVGETLGCGTGACAVAVLARATGRSQKSQTAVRSRGGELSVTWSAEGLDSEMILTGPAEIVYAGTLSHLPNRHD